jgi:hypothetical protein
MNDLQNAIDRSSSHNEIVRIEWSGGDEATLVSELGAIYDGEIDSTRENDGSIDVWGYRRDAGDGEMDWRLNVRLC